MAIIVADVKQQLENEGSYAPSLAEDPAEAMRAIRAVIRRKAPAFTRLCEAIEAYVTGDEAPVRTLGI